MDSWSPYVKGRLHRVTESGVVVVRPESWVEPTPISCPLCGVLYRSKWDEEAHSEFGCCDMCVLEHIGGPDDKVRWDEGWRPTDDVVKSAVSRRRKRSLGRKLSIG